MEIDWKKPAIAAAAAFVIAAVSAAFGRVGFGALVLRAVFGAVAFGGLAVGADLLVRRYLPELYGASGDASTSDDGESRVDITLDAENPHVEETGQSIAATEVHEQPETADAALEPELGGAEESPAAASSEVEDAEVVEELDTVDDSESSDEEADTAGENLPSLEGVESSFAGAGEDESEEADSSGGESSTGSIDVMGDQEDPSVVARAVRTLLKRDEEG